MTEKPTNSTDSDHFVNFVNPRSHAQDQAVRRRMAHGVCDVCFRVVMMNKMGRFKHVGEPIPN